MDEVGPETDTQEHRAYFIRFRSAEGRVGMVPISDDAPDEVLVSMKWIARDWIKEDLSKSPIDRLCRRVREGKPGPAIAIEPFEGKRLPPISPLSVMFEPVALDESSSTLVELAHESSNAIENDDAQKKNSDLSTARKFQLRSGVSVFWGVYSTLQLISSYQSRGIASVRTVFWAIMLLVAAILPIGWHLINNPSWFIVPGGIIVKGGFRFGRGNYPVMFTPGNSAMVIESVGPGFRASLIRDDKIDQQMRLTPIEAVALVGAWQSPIVAPALERLVDLR